MSIDIIGAGIGGLTTAIALEKKGIKTRIFEQAEQLKPVGAGIILANNAMQVYEKLGLREIIEQNGNPISSMNITKANLTAISKVDLKYFEQKHNVKNIAIHRGKLQEILLDQLKNSQIALNHKLNSINKIGNQNQLVFDNGKELTSQVAIGADGLNSVVRQHIFPKNNIRSAKQICWRGVTEFDLPKTYGNELNEAWGKADRFGFVQIAPNKVYWYALKTFKQSANEYDIENLENYFKDYNTVIRDIIFSTSKNEIHTAEISDLSPTNKWFKDTICLLGDAAHATTPNMGQGACQAIEDAYVLSECLNKYDYYNAFKQYQKLRLPKAHRVVNTSWKIGKLAHWKNPISRKLRNTVMRLTPSKVNRIQSEIIFKLETV